MTLDLDKLEALDKAATAGPWRDVKRETPHHRYCEDPLYYVKHATGDGSLVNVCEAISFARPEQDAALIAEMRTQLPALLQAARERDEAVRLLRRMHEARSYLGAADQEIIGAFLSRVGSADQAIPRVVRPSRLPVPPRLEFRRESDGELVSDECECECGHSRHRHTRYERRCQVDKCDCDAFRGSANEET